MKKIVLLFASALLLSSCGQSIEEKLLGKYWVDLEDEEIIYLEENGVASEIVYAEKATYTLAGDSIQLGISGWGKDYYKIIEIEGDKMLLQIDDLVFEMQIAKEGDFLLGEWDGKLQGKEVSLDFSDGELVITNWDADWDEDDYLYDDVYQVDGKKITSNSEVYSFDFELSEDFNTLTLTRGDDTFSFKRDI